MLHRLLMIAFDQVILTVSFATLMGSLVFGLHMMSGSGLIAIGALAVCTWFGFCKHHIFWASCFFTLNIGLFTLIHVLVHWV
jgi:hypothetical protein